MLTNIFFCCVFSSSVAIVENSIKHRNQSTPSSTSQPMTTTQLKKNTVPKENLEKEKPLKRKIKGTNSQPQGSYNVYMP